MNIGTVAGMLPLKDRLKMSTKERLKLVDQECNNLWDSMEGRTFEVVSNVNNYVEVVDTKTREPSGKAYAVWPVGTILKPVRNSPFLEVVCSR